MKRISRSHFHFKLIVLAALLCLPHARVFGQLSSASTIAGTVTDSSGAVVIGASITVLNEESQIKTQTKSDSAGSFAVPALPPGRYSVTVEQQGFQTYTETGLVLHPTLVATVNLVLKVGNVTTGVTVSASAVVVQTATPEVSSQVSAEQVSMLPLNGRNFQSLSALMPGVANTAPGKVQVPGGFNQQNTMSVNGMGYEGTAYFVDGIWDENTGNMLQITITPNPDSIQEVRVLQNNYGVEYSLNGANAVVVQTKSGTSTFHGTAFEYLRNDDLNTRNYFSTTISPYKQNIFGYTLGGPFYIPGRYNVDKTKTFFFVSEQWVRNNQGSTILGAAPLPTMFQGIFPSTGTYATPFLTDPTLPPGHCNSPTNNTSCFPKDAAGDYVIPQGRIVPDSVALANALFQPPNQLASGTFNNIINQVPNVFDDRDDMFKVDQYFGSRFLLTGEYLDSRSHNISPNNPTLGATAAYSTVRVNRYTPLQLAKVNLSQTWTQSMVNTTSISMNNYVTRFVVFGTTELSQVPGYHQVLPFSGGTIANNLLPQLSFSGPAFSPAGNTSNVPQPHAGDLEDSFSDSWSYLRGNHYLQAGVQYVRGTARSGVAAQNHGLWSFTGLFTSNSMADFLLGDAASLQQANTRLNAVTFYRILSPYVQDRWKVTRNVTISAGLRFEHYPGIREQSGTATNFVPSLFNNMQVPIVNANGTITPTPNYNPTNGLITNGVNGAPQTFANGHTDYWGPSLGFALDVFGNGKTALRGGYGISFYSPLNSFCACTSNPPFIQTVTLARPSFPNSTGTGTPNPLGASTLSVVDPHRWHLPEIQSYSMSVEQQIPGNLFFSIAGAGNIVRHGPVNYNANQPLPTGSFDFDPAINTGTFAYVYGPYQGYAAITTVGDLLNQYWNGLEVSVRHPAGHGLFFSAAYTWQHALGIDGGLTGFSAATVQDSYNIRRDYGNLSTNIPQVATFSVVYQVPFFSKDKGLKRTLLGGWQLSDITTLQTGFSLGASLGTADKGLAIRPNNIPGVSPKGPKTLTKWFNTAAYVAPAHGFFGTGGVNQFLGPGLVNFDMTIYKDFHINEHHFFQFRTESFNTFNHTNFNSVSTAIGSGNVGAVTGAADPRILEGVLRYEF